MNKIKIAPSKKTGSHHWVHQRVSAIALIPLVIWFLYSIVTISYDVDANLAVFFAYPVNAIAAILLIGAALYHGSIGLQVVYEDYISCKGLKIVMIYATSLLSIVTVVATVFSIIRLHLIG
jgi:succinate dehydrogenase / fumarate reductase, membrane anchor subunit